MNPIVRFVDSEPRIQDIVLAQYLGYRRPRDIRPFIRKHLKKLNEFGVCERPRISASNRSGRPADSYWLTRSQAIELISLRKTSNAVAALIKVRDLFDSDAPGAQKAPSEVALDTAPTHFGDLLSKVDKTLDLLLNHLPLSYEEHRRLVARARARGVSWQQVRQRYGLPTGPAFSTVPRESYSSVYADLDNWLRGVPPLKSETTEAASPRQRPAKVYKRRLQSQLGKGQPLRKPPTPQASLEALKDGKTTPPKTQLPPPYGVYKVIEQGPKVKHPGLEPRVVSRKIAQETGVHLRYMTSKGFSLAELYKLAGATVVLNVSSTGGARDMVPRLPEAEYGKFLEWVKLLPLRQLREYQV